MLKNILYAKTKERLIAIGQQLGLDKKSTLQIIRRRVDKKPFDEKKWNDYIVAISGQNACRLCGGLQHVVNGRVICTRNSNHTAAINAIFLSENKEYATTLARQFEERVSDTPLSDYLAKNSYTNSGKVMTIEKLFEEIQHEEDIHSSR